MFSRSGMTRLLPALALASFVLAAPAAQAFTCVSTLALTANNTFNDCSDTPNFAGFEFGTLEHDTVIDGPFPQDDFFTDLHITFNDASVTILSGFFQNNETGNDWDETISGDLKTISWVVTDFGDRVRGGAFMDDYDWFIDLEGTSGLTALNVTIEYTMDVVPEPSSAALTVLGLIGLAARRRRS